MAGTESQWQTPPKAAEFLAHLLASFASVLVPAIPTQTGTPTCRRFSFDQLRLQLEAYRRWRLELESSVRADQATVDSLFNPRRAAVEPAAAPQPRLQPTMQKVFDAVRTSQVPIGAADIADQLGVSRPTAARYLSALERKGLVVLDLAYGTTGRPLNSYTAHPSAR